jgi:cysteine dioxygenase
MRCVSGELTETCYSWPEREDEPPAPLKERVLKPGQVAYINDKCGLHRILNHTDVGATSLHLYMPPYDKCKIWIDEKCQRMQVGSVTFYSEDGQVVVDD